MNYTEEDLKTLEDCGRAQFDVEKTAIIMQKDEGELKQALALRAGVIYETYERGKLQAEFEVRKSIYDLAVQGSSQAQMLYMKMRDELKIHEA